MSSKVEPTWLGVGVHFLEVYSQNERFDFAYVAASFYTGLATAKSPPVDTRTTEHGLFLNVTVSQQTFDSKSNSAHSSAVLV